VALAEVIKYEGDNTTFVWKHPTEDFNTLSQLIVHESQEAVLFLNGQALDLFGPGRHTLETQNIPLLGKVLNLATGGVTPFHCEVYFINRTEQMAIKWGTDSKVQFLEPTYGFPLQIGASGEMSLRVSESRRLLVKVVGTERILTQEQIVRYFRGFLMAHLKAYLVKVIKERNISIFEIDENLNEMSGDLRSQLLPLFADYGVDLARFFVTTVVRPDGDEYYEKFKELHFRQYADPTEARIRQQVGVIDQETAAKQMVIEAEGLAQKRTTEGFSYQEERRFDVAEKMAENEAVGEMTNLGVGLGMISAVSGPVSGLVGTSVSDALNTAVAVPSPQAPIPTPAASPGAFCDQCGVALVAGAAFCMDCGAPVPTPAVPTCKRCGHVFQRPGRFCPQCGQESGV
jgi:membrane protease subunit (stomatin/prohibitin family)